jgi:hypothetical protein
VEIKSVSFPAIARRNHEWLVIDYESDVTDETLIEDFVSGSAIVDCALWLADEARPRSGSVRIRHGRVKLRQSPRMDEKRV